MTHFPSSYVREFHKVQVVGAMELMMGVSKIKELDYNPINPFSLINVQSMCGYLSLMVTIWSN
jgi:hypothetical protein